MGEFFGYFFRLILLTIGTFVGCGLIVRICSRIFNSLTGNNAGKIFDVTSTIGTPIHELGHAAMCLVFGHKIVEMKLWIPPAQRTDGTAGYVSHQWTKNNVWKSLGNLFIGLGPIFSGLGVVVLMLWICFPDQWSAYLETSSNILAQPDVSIPDIFVGVFSLFKSIPAAFADHWFRSLIGLIVIFAVSMHIDLSGADIKGSLSAIPIYLFLIAIVAIPTYLLHWNEAIDHFLVLLNMRMLSLFCIVIAFAVLWVLLALIIRLIRNIF